MGWPGREKSFFLMLGLELRQIGGNLLTGLLDLWHADAYT